MHVTRQIKTLQFIIIDSYEILESDILSIIDDMNNLTVYIPDWLGHINNPNLRFLIKCKIFDLKYINIKQENKTIVGYQIIKGQKYSVLESILNQS